MARVARNELARDLQAFGFTALEADVYVVLTQSTVPLTGYEVAKSLGITRANVYTALAHLELMGVVLKRLEPRGNVYQPVAFEAIADHVLAGLAQKARRLTQAFTRSLNTVPMVQGIGWDLMTSWAQSLTLQARNRILVGATIHPVKLLAPTLTQSIDRGVAVEFACWDGCPAKGCGVCRPPIRYPTDIASVEPLILVVDGTQALLSTGHDSQASVIMTASAPLVSGLQLLLGAPPGSSPPLN